MFLKKTLEFFKISSAIILITFILSLAIDFFFGKVILNKLDPYLSQTNFYDRLIRIDHKFYHHTFKKNVNYKKATGFDGNLTFCTDNHGFKYKCNAKRGKEFEIAFLGDSFVEGLALNYEETFVGIFENKKKITVANLGVTSYAPSIYLSKMKFLLDNDYKFKHLILFIDISDLYDDNTFYKINENLTVTEKNAEGKNLKMRKFLRNNFPLTNFYMFVIKMNNRLNKDLPPVNSKNPIFNAKASIKAKWSYQTTDIVTGYDEPISKTQEEMLQTMTELSELLEKNQIKLSLAVYPWPQQLQYDNRNSKHVKMWKNFCEGKCHKFLNFFPHFFNEKDKKSFLEVYKKYYFWNDVHFNSEGNRVIAQKLLKEF